MNIEHFSQQVQAWNSQMIVLLQPSQELSSPQALLKEVFKEFQAALEELTVAEEELRQQNHELTIAQIALEAERQRYQDLFEFAPDGYIITDTIGTIQEANHAAATLINIKPQFLVGKPLLIFIAKEEHCAFRTKIKHLRQADCIGEWEVHLQPRHCKVIDVAITIRAVRDNVGKLVALRWLLRDISNRKQVEAEIAQVLAREQAARSQGEVANRMKDEFLAIVSHELRSPITAVLGWAQMLRTGKFNQEMTAKGLETIERNARLQTQLIDDLLDVSGIITGKLRLTIYPIELAPILEAAINTIRPAVEAKRINLICMFEPSVNVVLGDPERLQQVIWNLLSNAVKFTPPEGQIKVELKSINAQVEIAVSDSGIGIRPEFLPFVFDRFRQADTASTRSYTGLGLGLAIVRHLVELHGGTVEVSSLGEGLGTTFTVKLPSHAAASIKASNLEQVHLTQENKATLSDHGSLEGLQILVVDDEADMRELFAMVLEKSGALVKAVSSVQQAIELIKYWKPHVLVSDISMPEEDGYALIRQVRSLKPEDGGMIPAIALTASARGEERIRSLQEGFQLPLSKPIEPTNLVSVVATLVKKMAPP